MTSTKNPLSEFVLTPQQQNLLFAALNSNRPAQNSALTMSPMSFNGSPARGLDTLGSFQTSPELDYEYDFGAADSSFDLSYDIGSQPKMIGDLPGTSVAGRSDSADADSPDKRSHPDDDEDNENEPKRRESEDKVAKKPGRKPLTTEPSSKRKAQNRAAQRAFRERKEKHLKDLETKVQELEAKSQTTSSENERLKAKVDKLTVELNEYKKRVTTLSRGSRSTGAPNTLFGTPLTNNIGDVNFQFEFPKFGALPGPPEKKASPPKTGLEQMSPADTPSSTTSPMSNGNGQEVSKNDFSNFTAGLFSPPLTSQNVADAGRHNSSDSHFSMGAATSTSSPSASSSNMGGPSSSCGTSPEPYTQSPMGFKPVDTLTTIGEEQTGLNGTQDFDPYGNLGADWLPHNFQFDPQLFGDYREPQDNIFTGLDNSVFDDAFDVDFVTPYNLPITTPAPAAPPKNDLIAQIDAAKEGDERATVQLLTCNKIWEKLQTCPRVQNGDFDLDGLCSDLQKKAKCSGTGAVVDEQDFKAVMKKYLGDKQECDLNEVAKEMKA
ncbi:hypothetical protein OQA88_10056 [Cercophora sp. LCS_1]